MSQPYRPDVDGLRAVAVLLVLGFHAFPERLPGGFVGVDVFFVISGYLITGIILSSVEAGTFRISDFYARRIRRIFPSLVVVSAASLWAGWYVFLPDELAQLGKHVFAGGVFVSNLAFWREAGYFDTAADTKPLLHLWSLGIEEQFYLIWPLFLSLAWKHRRNVGPPTLWAALGSFALCAGILARDATAAFYFPLTRFWELIMGGLLAVSWETIPLSGTTLTTARAWATRANVQGVKSAAGALLIALSALAFTRGTLFPGWAALPPTLGAALIISAGPTALLNRVVFARPAMVWVGLISFPLYLWHWPMLSFARILNAGAPSPALRTALLAVSVVLAATTYVFIERPIRFARRRRLAVAIPSLGLLTVAVLGLTLYLRQGIPSRFTDLRMLALMDDLNQGGWGPASERQKDCPDEPVGDGRNTYCRWSSRNPPTIALVGDSHAIHLFPGLAEADPKRSWLLMARAGCPPVIGITVDMGEQPCGQFGESAVRKVLSLPDVTTVVLSFISTYLADAVVTPDHRARGMYPSLISSTRFPPGPREEMFLQGLNEVVKVLERSGRSVIVSLDIPELPFYPRDCLRLSMTALARPDSCRLSKTDVLARQASYRDMLQRLISTHPNVQLFDPLSLFCTGGACFFRDDDRLFYRDSHHLSLRGSTRMAEGLLSWMSRAPTGEAATERGLAGRNSGYEDRTR